MKNINTIKWYTIVPLIKRPGTNSPYAKLIHTSTSFPALNPWFITGFIDGEGCFSITIFKSNTHKTGWQVKLEFKLNLHEKDKALLEQLQNYFSVGQIFKQGPEKIRFIVQSACKGRFRCCNKSFWSISFVNKKIRRLQII